MCYNQILVWCFVLDKYEYERKTSMQHIMLFICKYLSNYDKHACRDESVTETQRRVQWTH